MYYIDQFLNSLNQVYIISDKFLLVVVYNYYIRFVLLIFLSSFFPFVLMRDTEIVFLSYNVFGFGVRVILVDLIE